MRSKAVRLVSLTMVCIVVLVAAAQIPQEYQVKAALIYYLAKFVEWPAAALAETSPSITLCIVGEDPFGADLDQLIAGKSVNGKVLLVRRSRLVQDVPGCHIVFLGTAERKDLVQIFEAAQNFYALTIGETDQFASPGGV